MNPKDKRPILYKGEIYSKEIPKGGGGPAKEPRQSYDHARAKIVSDIKKTREAIKNIPEGFKLPNEFVVSLRLDPAFSAKSYYPGALFESNTRDGAVEEIGSRIWRSEEEGPTGKMLFVRTTEKGLEDLEGKLNQSEAAVKKNFALDVRKLKSLDLLAPEEQIMGIPESWDEGRLEAVLHPFAKDKGIVLDRFIGLLEKSGVDTSRVRSKQYEEGVTFVSLYANRDVLGKIAGYNPLRAIHPLALRKIPVTRSVIKASAPLPPNEKDKSKVILGVFDGGLQPNNPYTEPYSERVDLMGTSPDDGDVQHGTMVTGAALYGPINDFNSKDTLPRPLISVRNFRVLPTTDEDDMDLYEVIDAIEKTIPTQRDISVYNISFGPIGPILDDHISRFTFACDLLAAKQNILFCNAVGNEGDFDPEYLRRIQSPSDMVNGLAVGAFTTRKGQIMRAPYSCLGPGREGNKLKPDISAFGGCDHTPMHLISTEDGSKDSTSGTSFASPIVANRAAQLVGYSNGAISPLVARGMLIHGSESRDTSGHNNEFGHGILPENMDDFVTCKSNSFTLIYQGELEFGKFTAFKIPWINEIKTGKVKFRWTSLVLAGVDPHSPDDYTTGSTLVSFYPHSNKFIFSKGGKTQRLDLNIEALTAKQLIRDGWEQSAFPISASGAKAYTTEDELRADMKWDTVDCRHDSKMAEGVFEPMFHIHALRRGQRQVARKIKFALILTVETTVPDIDLYSQVVSKYRALVPINLDIQTKVQVKNS